MTRIVYAVRWLRGAIEPVGILNVVEDDRNGVTAFSKLAANLSIEEPEEITKKLQVNYKKGEFNFLYKDPDMWTYLGKVVDIENIYFAFPVDAADKMPSQTGRLAI